MRTSTLMSALVLACLATSAQAAKDDDPTGTKALHDYVLSMDKVKKFTLAIEAMQAAGKSDAALKADMEQMNGEPEAKLSDVEAKLDRHPHVFAFYAKQGLTRHDVAVLPIALMDACSVAQMPAIGPKMADRVDASQVAFCKTHMGELKAIKVFSSGR